MRENNDWASTVAEGRVLCGLQMIFHSWPLLTVILVDMAALLAYNYSRHVRHRWAPPLLLAASSLPPCLLLCVCKPLYSHEPACIAISRCEMMPSRSDYQVEWLLMAGRPVW